MEFESISKSVSLYCLCSDTAQAKCWNQKVSTDTIFNSFLLHSCSNAFLRYFISHSKL